MAQEARFYEKLDDGKVRCVLCPRRCVIADGKRGFCGIRKNQGGTLFATTYGRVSSIALDPIEKKPLFHFHPGSHILSLGGAGCSFRCEFCQNWHLLAEDVAQKPLPVEKAVELAQRENSTGIAYTYNEPYVAFEYVHDTARAAKEAGLKNVLVTNGYYMPEPFEQLAPFIDAMNIDLKSMREEFYKQYVHGELAPVQRTIEAAVNRGILVELTSLLIPGLNDSEEELRDLVDYVASLSPEIPLHFSRYHPAFNLNLPPTPAQSLQRAREIAERKLKYVYLGNVVGMDGSDTKCPECGALLVQRLGYSVAVAQLQGASCGACGAELNFVA